MSNSILLEKTYKNNTSTSDERPARTQIITLVTYRTCEVKQNFHLRQEICVYADYHSCCLSQLRITRKLSLRTRHLHVRGTMKG